MPFSHLPALLGHLASPTWPPARPPLRRPPAPCCSSASSSPRGRRTVTSWFRAAGITDDFRHAYTIVCAVGRRRRRHGPPPAAHRRAAAGRRPPAAGHRRHAHAPATARASKAPASTTTPARPRRREVRLRPRLGHPGRPGQAPRLGHPRLALAGQALRPPTRTWPSCHPTAACPFRTKLELAAEQLHWLMLGVGRPQPRSSGWWSMAATPSGRSCGRPAGPAWWWSAAWQGRGLVVLARRPDRRRRRGPSRPTASSGSPWPSVPGSTRGWQQVECVQYGERVTKTIKTFLATWRPAGGVIRVVLVQEEDGWLAFFCTEPGGDGGGDPGGDGGSRRDRADDQGRQGGVGGGSAAGAERARQRGLLQPEPVDVQRGGGVGVGAVRRRSWWTAAGARGTTPRRPSHADKRKALQREVLRQEIQVMLASWPGPEEIAEMAETLLRLAARSAL